MKDHIVIPALFLVTLALAVSWLMEPAVAPVAHAPVAVPVTPQTPRQHAIAAVDAAYAAIDRQRELALQFDRALASRDAALRETAFAVLLPELLATDTERVVDTIAHLAPGDTREALTGEVARQWIVRDTEAALRWLESLAGDAQGPARIAVRALAAVSPAQAIDAADRLGVGRDDGSLEHIVQIWAAEHPHEARRWLDGRPESPLTAQLRARLSR